MSRPSELSTPKTIAVVVLVLENHQGEYLLTQRTKNQHLSGYWEFPGGKIEAGESPLIALQRELLEELDYTTQNPTPLTTICHSYPQFQVRLHVYHESADHPKFTPLEQQAYQWVGRSELQQIQLPEANQAIIDILCS